VNRNKAIERSELAQATLKYFSKICNDKVFRSDRGRSGRKLQSTNVSFRSVRYPFFSMFDNNNDGLLTTREWYGTIKNYSPSGMLTYPQFYYFLDKNAFKICADPRRTTGRSPATKKKQPSRPKKSAPVPKKAVAAPRITNKMFKPLFDLLDTDRNGKITPTNIKNLFKRLDRN
jgi:hypothetical protein